MMGKGAKAAAAAAAAAAQAATETSPVPSPLPSNVRHGAMVTIGFFLVYYMFLFAQGTMKRKLRAHYTAQGKKFERYFTRDTKMLGWDRTAGNMLEQAPPFLAFFWLSIWLSSFGGLPLVYIATLGWLYVLLRCAYPMVWFAGGGGSGGSSSLMWRLTFPMYAIILTFVVNAAVVVSTA